MTDADDLLRRRVKAELRKRMRGLRRTTPASACAERSQRIVERLWTMDAMQAARGVALFWPIEARHEVDLRDLDATLRGRASRVAYPSIDPETQVMTFRFVDDVDTLVERGLGFREPAYGAPEASKGEIDVVVAPALAVDASGHRLGYGGGYYDRTLPRFAPPAVAVAVAYDFQLVPELPAMPTDVAASWVVTDARLFRAGAFDDAPRS